MDLSDPRLTDLAFKVLPSQHGKHRRPLALSALRHSCTLTHPANIQSSLTIKFDLDFFFLGGGGDFRFGCAIRLELIAEFISEAVSGAGVVRECSQTVITRNSAGSII